MKVKRLNLTYVRVCALPECGKEFVFKLRNKKKLYCNRKCASVARRAGGSIAQKVDETTLKHHGVRRFFCDQERMKNIMQAEHGVDNVSHVPGLRKESWKKAHETKKQNGTYKTSKIERDVFETLQSEGCAVLAQCVVLGRPIDITIIEDEIHVQVDGRYWHGLDRPIEEIKASTYPRDRSIAERWEADRRQDEQFAERGLRLVRITDHEAREWLRSKQKFLPLLRQRAMLPMRSMTSQHS